MAERRMFTKKITNSDAFIDMPLSTQALYFHLNMEADDDGFNSSPKKVQRMIGASDDDLKLLILKNFIIPFESGIVVIKHWRLHNYIQKDRYKETVYLEEKNMLNVKANKTYTLMDTKCVQNGYETDTQVRLDEDSIDKDSKEDIILSATSNVDVPEDDVFIKIILNDKSYYHITNVLLNQYKELYPAVDVEQELRKFTAWALSNPTKRKTRKGILRSINNWLSREQDKGGNKNAIDKTSNEQDLSKYDR